MEKYPPPFFSDLGGGLSLKFTRFAKKIKRITQPITHRIPDKSALILSKKCPIFREEIEFDSYKKYGPMKS